jgi:hypothetical protein
MQNNTWIWLLGGAGLLWWLSTQQTAATVVPVTVSTDPTTGTTTATDVNGNNVPTTFGVNGGKGTDPMTGQPSDYDFASNYTVLIVANPNLINPNYQLTPAEIAQYIANYLDLRGGGLTTATAQSHWQNYGVSQERIFLPLVPVSSEPWSPNG